MNLHTIKPKINTNICPSGIGNVIPIRPNLAHLPSFNTTLNVSIPQPWASVVRTQAAWANKTPEAFLNDFVAAGFPEVSAR